MIYRSWFFSRFGKKDGKEIYKAVKGREAIIGTKEEIMLCIDKRELEKMRKEMD